MSGDFSQAFNPPVNVQITNLSVHASPIDDLPVPPPATELLVPQPASISDLNVNIGTDPSCSDPQKVKKARQSFSLKDKIAFITEYQHDCNDFPSADGDDRKKKFKLKSWLKEKNARDGTNFSYGTIYKWYKSFYGKIGHDAAELSSIGNLKKVRKRPHEELESILVQYLRVRNETLRSQGLPTSNPAFIREKALMFFKDMYGEGPIDGKYPDFKCSNAWVQRFRNRYMHIFDPVAAQNKELEAAASNDLQMNDNHDVRRNPIMMPALNESILQTGLIVNQAAPVETNHPLQIPVQVPGEDLI